MLTEVVQPQPSNGSSLDTDLGALAEHLSVIADALRKSTQNESASSQNVRQQSRPGSVLEAVQNAPHGGSYPRTHDAAFPRDLASPVVTTDAVMTRQRYCAMAREAYAVRRSRSHIFKNDELFGEPAWDILLDLYIAHSERKPVSVSSACIGSAAPPTTGLRWLGVLAEHELILREHDPEDQRRVLVCLTEKGLSAMDSYFASVVHNR